MTDHTDHRTAAVHVDETDDPDLLRQRYYEARAMLYNIVRERDEARRERDKLSKEVSAGLDALMNAGAGWHEMSLAERVRMLAGDRDAAVNRAKGAGMLRDEALQRAADLDKERVRLHGRIDELIDERDQLREEAEATRQAHNATSKDYEELRNAVRDAFQEGSKSDAWQRLNALVDPPEQDECNEEPEPSLQPQHLEWRIRMLEQDGLQTHHEVKAHRDRLNQIEKHTSILQEQVDKTQADLARAGPDSESAIRRVERIERALRDAVKYMSAYFAEGLPPKWQYIRDALGDGNVGK